MRVAMTERSCEKNREDKNEREQVTKYKFGFDFTPALNRFFKHIS